MPGAPLRPAHVQTPEAGTVKDLVCGMNVTPGKAKGGSATHAGHEYWFCNPRCREKFVADPAKYLAPSPPVAPVETDAIVSEHA